MAVSVEVFADVSCPFAHLSLLMVPDVLAELDREVDLTVRAWPLEWVNGQPFAAGHIGEEIDALRATLDTDAFAGFDPDTWPTTTIPAFNLADAAHRVDPALGLTVGLALRHALFEEGRDVGDPEVLAAIAEDHDLAPPSIKATPGVRADYAEGQRRGVKGSPDFWVGDEEFFCPALEIGHDDDDRLTARVDPEGLRQFLDRVTR
jgi:predicted DsbA family dithiol-disulfide isomerase